MTTIFEKTYFNLIGEKVFALYVPFITLKNLSNHLTEFTFYK